MVYGVCRVLLCDADEAEDAAQQTFLSAHRSMLGGHHPRDPAAWLGTIARNECRARIRARMERPLVLLDERDGCSPDLENVVGRRAEIEALCAALAELPQQQREAIVLREFYGLSYEEVRAALGVTDAAVESLLFRARRRLQKELRPARIASGALALPLALRDSLANLIPGFAASPEGVGTLAKLASAPGAAKLAAAAVTVTIAGTVGVASFDGRDADRTPPAPGAQAARTPATGPGGEPLRWLSRDPPVVIAGPPARQADEDDDETAEPEEPEGENEAEEIQPAEADQEQGDQEQGEAGQRQAQESTGDSESPEENGDQGPEKNGD